MRQCLVPCIMVSMAGCDAEPAPPAAERTAATTPAAPAPAAAPPAVPRIEQFRDAKAKARAWLDTLEVDTVDLTAHGVKGKKKLGEILEAYLHYLNATDDPAERASIRQRVEQLVRQTARPGYHNLFTAPYRELKQDSMSYFRVLTLMEKFGFDTTAYRAEVFAVQPRIDDHLPDRGLWQQAMFRTYYLMYGLELPPLLAGLEDPTGIVAERLPAGQLSLGQSYRLTHQVFVAFEYGYRKTQDHFSPDDLSYLHTVLPALVRKTRHEGSVDLLSQLVSAMTYLGLHDDDEYRAAVDHLLARQNPDGTWGDYEHIRARYGDYVDQRNYLHTTMVVMRALLEAFEGDWNVQFRAFGTTRRRARENPESYFPA